MSSFVLSEDARIHIRNTLEKTKEIEAEQMDEAIQFIDSSIGNAEILEISGNPTESAKELSELHESIVGLLEEIRALSLDSKLALDGYFTKGDGEQSVTNKISGFPRLRSSKYTRFIDFAEAMEKAASNASSEINVRSGRTVNFKAKSIAIHLRESLECLHINLSTYDDGPYMSILRVAFSELVPTKKGAAYRRHGLWAMKVDDMSEFNWASMKDDTQK